jgi:hypothetical protein
MDISRFEAYVERYQKFPGMFENLLRQALVGTTGDLSYQEMKFRLRRAPKWVARLSTRGGSRPPRFWVLWNTFYWTDGAFSGANLPNRPYQFGQVAHELVHVRQNQKIGHGNMTLRYILELVRNNGQWRHDKIGLEQAATRVEEAVYEWARKRRDILKGFVVN